MSEISTAGYSHALHDLLAAALGIPAERVSTEFAAPPTQRFGWNGVAC